MDREFGGQLNGTGQFQQSLGDDEVAAAGTIASGEAAYAVSEASAAENDAANLVGPLWYEFPSQAGLNYEWANAYVGWLNAVAPTFDTDSKTVAQDDATDQDALVTDAVDEAKGEATAEVAYAQAEGPAVSDESWTCPLVCGF